MNNASAITETYFIDGHDLEAVRFEATDSVLPTIVMLHEGLGSVSHWKDFPARLAEDIGAAVFLYSRYGHGRSELLAGNQEWLDRIQPPDGTKLKIKNVLSTIFSHGVRWELVERNPVCGQGGSPGHRGASTGVRQSNRVSIQRVILDPDVVRQTLEQLPLREATMALVDAVTASYSDVWLQQLTEVSSYAERLGSSFP